MAEADATAANMAYLRQLFGLGPSQAPAASAPAPDVSCPHCGNALSPSWLNSVSGTTSLLDRPTAWSAPDELVNQPPPAARRVTNPELFGAQDPGIFYGYGQAPTPVSDNQDTVIRAPQPQFAPTMPKSFFGSTAYGPDAEKDRDMRDRRILNMQNYSPETGEPTLRDRDLSALSRIGG